MLSCIMCIIFLFCYPWSTNNDVHLLCVVKADEAILIPNMCSWKDRKCPQNNDDAQLVCGQLEHDPGIEEH